MRQTFNIKFLCRPSKKGKDGFAPIELSIVINKKRKYLRLQRKEKPEDFAKAKNSQKTNSLQAYLNNQRQLINDYINQMSLVGIELTADNLRDCLKKGCVAQLYSLGDMWRDIMSNQREKVSTGDIEYDTLRKYNRAKKEFYAANDFTDATNAQSVELQNIINLQLHLRKQGMKQCTIYQYHARVKAAFTLAQNRGKIIGTPYASFKLEKGEKKEIVWLTKEELNTLANKSFDCDRLEQVRDLFLFQCYSGLAYKDMAMLTKADYQTNDLDQIYIEKRRAKTNQRFTSVVAKEGKAILAKYDYELPVLSNQKYNSYLKEIQALCRIQKTLHTHLGRTTYVCILYNYGIEPSIIAKMVGHSTTYTTLKYYAEMDKTTIFDAARKTSFADKTKEYLEKGFGGKTEDVIAERLKIPELTNKH